MKASDFRPEHFEQGRSFKKSDFSAYLEASANLTKTIYTRYFPSVGAGLLLSFLFSRGAGGFAGNILALVCIFGGLIVGGIFNARAAREVNELAKRLGITRADVALARRHVKNGTTAWSGGDGSAAGEEDESLSKKTPEAEQSAAYQSARFPAALPEKEARALWAALFLTAGWFLLLLLLKRRIGLYFILLGVGLVLGSRLVQALAILATSGNTSLSLNILIQTVLGALNPLFAWLAVRAGTAGDPGQHSPVSASVEHVGKRAGTAANSTETADVGKIRKSAADWMPLVDRLARFQTFSFDRSEESAMGEELLSGGNAALQAIVAYLSSCACGRQSSYWWSNAAYLVKLIAKFPGADHESLYKKLMAPETNIWEYHMQIKDVAEQELLNLKKSSPEYDGTVISEEDARAELKALNASGSAEERIRRAIDMRPSVENWSDENKAFYYFIIGDALRMRDRADKRRYPFYAAQVFYQAAKTSLGWHELLNSGDFEGLKPSPENAKRLHEQFPLPESWEDLLKPEV